MLETRNIPILLRSLAIRIFPALDRLEPMPQRGLANDLIREPGEPVLHVDSLLFRVHFCQDRVARLAGQVVECGKEILEIGDGEEGKDEAALEPVSGAMGGQEARTEAEVVDAKVKGRWLDMKREGSVEKNERRVIARKRLFLDLGWQGCGKSTNGASIKFSSPLTRISASARGSVT
jgi:hypothetical protein